MEWAEQEEWFADLAKEGEAPKVYTDRPDIRRDLMTYWQAFWALTGDRQVFMGGVSQIPFTSIDSYASRYRINSIDEFERLHVLLGAMDDAFLKWNADKVKGEDNG